MKKIMIILVSVMSVFSLVGCSNQVTKQQEKVDKYDIKTLRNYLIQYCKDNYTYDEKFSKAVDEESLKESYDETFYNQYFDTHKKTKVICKINKENTTADLSRNAIEMVFEIAKFKNQEMYDKFYSNSNSNTSFDYYDKEKLYAFEGEMLSYSDSKHNLSEFIKKYLES